MVIMRLMPAARIFSMSPARNASARSNKPALIRGLPQHASDKAQEMPLSVSQAPTARVTSGA